MDVRTQRLPQSVVRCTITLTPEEVVRWERDALRTMSANLELPGFRKGHVPQDVARQYIKDDQLFHETARMAVERHTAEAMLREHVEPLAQPNIEIMKMAPGNDLVWRCTVAVFPEIVLGDWRGEKVLRKKAAVGEQEVADAVLWLRKSRGNTQAVARPAAKGDLVEIDFTARDMGGVKLEGGEAKGFVFELGERRFVSGFEEQVQGMRAGESKDFPLSFPHTWPQKSFAGKLVSFSVTVKGVMERVLPSADDAFAKSVGSFAGIGALQEHILQGRLAEKQEKERERARVSAIEAVASRASFEIPELLVARENEKMLHELRAHVEAKGGEFSRYLETLGKSEADLAASWHEDAVRRVKIALVLRALAHEEGVTVSDAEAEEKAEALRNAEVPGSGPKTKIDPEELMAYAKAIIRNEKVCELLERTIIEDEL